MERFQTVVTYQPSHQADARAYAKERIRRDISRMLEERLVFGGVYEIRLHALEDVRTGPFGDVQLVARVDLIDATPPPTLRPVDYGLAAAEIAHYYPHLANVDIEDISPLATPDPASAGTLPPQR